MHLKLVEKSENKLVEIELGLTLYRQMQRLFMCVGFGLFYFSMIK